MRMCGVPSDESSGEVVLRLHPAVARALHDTLYDVGEHFAAGAELRPGPRELEQELAVVMWDLREALGMEHPTTCSPRLEVLRPGASASCPGRDSNPHALASSDF